MRNQPNLGRRKWGDDPIELTLDSEVQGDWQVVSVVGELDVYNSPKLRDELSAFIDSGKSKVIIDMRGVEFMDSSGLGVLVSALRRLRDAGGTLRLVGSQASLTRVLAITGLDKLFALYPEIEEAKRDAVESAEQVI